MMMVPPSTFAKTKKASTLASILGSHLPDSALSALPVQQLHLDSRNIQKGDGFVALKGGLYDGKAFISEAIEKGASVVLIDAAELEDFDYDKSLPIVPINQLGEHLSLFAGNLYHHPSAALSVVGITGTNGKTSCVQFYAQAMALLAGRCGVIGTTGFGVFKSSSSHKNINRDLSTTGMTTPDPIAVQKIIAQFADQSISHCAMEVSSHGLVQHRVAAVDINTAVFTNLSHDHLDYHQTMDAYGKAKAKLFVMPSVKNVVINTDDDYASTLVKNLAKDVQVITYGCEEKPSSIRSDSHLAIDSIEILKSQMTQVQLHIETADELKRYSFQTHLLGRFNLNNLLAVIGALHAEGFAMDAIMAVVPLIKPIDGRMELIESDADVSVVVDFAHTPDALHKALVALDDSTEASLWCVFGCGGDRDKAKRPEMAKVVEALADHIVITNDNPRTEAPEAILDDIAVGFDKRNFLRIPDRADAINYAITHANKNDTILIAGKGHETYQIIGKEKHYFSDQEQAIAALNKRKAGVIND